MTTRNPGETSALFAPRVVFLRHFFFAVFSVTDDIRSGGTPFFSRFFSVTGDRLSGGGTTHILAS